MAHNSNDRDTHDIDEPETVDIVDDPSIDNDNDHNDGHEEPSKSKKGKYIMYGGIAVLAGVLGVTAMQMFGGSDSSTPVSKPQPVPVTQEKEIPVTPQSIETTAPQQANVPTVPVTPEQNTNVSPESAPISQGVSLPPAQNGEQVLPDLNKSIDNGNPNKVKGLSPEETATTAPDLNSSATVPPVVESVPTPTVNQPTNVPVPQNTAPEIAQPQSVPVQEEHNTVRNDVPSIDNSQDTGVAPIAPIGEKSSAPVMASTPSLSEEASDDLNDSIKLLIKKMDGLSDSMDNLSDAVKDTNKRVDNTDKKVDELTKRVEKLEGKISNATNVAPNTNVVKKEVSKKAPVVKKKRSKSYNNSVELSNTSSRHVSHVKKSYAPKRTTEASSRLGSGYTLQSVVTDRAWIKRTDGTMATYGIGDRMPNGKVVGSIDPDNGVFDTNGKLIIK